MAKQPKTEIKDIEKQLNELKSKLDRDTSEALTKLIQKLKSGTSSLSEWNSLLDVFSIKADTLSDDLDYVSRSLTDSVNELIRGNEYINQQVRSTKKLSSISQDLLSMRRGDSTYDLKKIKNLEEQAKKQRRILSSQLDQYAADSKDRKELESKIETTDKLLDSFKDITQEAKKFQKNMGITGGILKGMSQIPIVGNMLGTQEALEAAEEAAKNGAGRLGTMAAAAKSMGNSLTSSLTDPLFLIGTLIKGFKKLVEIGFAADVQVTDLSKSMAVSKDEAEGVRDRMREISKSTNDVLMTTKGQVEAQLELADAFGVTRGFSEQQVKDQVTLTKAMKLSAEEASGIQQLAMANGQSADDVTNSVIKQTSALAKQKGIQLDNKKVLGEVSKVSGQLRLQYQNNPALIAKAVVQANKLGISLNDAKKAAEGLLDFEQSIENELSAELLTGKSLNLERARALALEGKSAEAAGEMLKQVGSAADFAKMNVIQQDALAKSVGMSADELANSLVYQENLNKLGDQTKQQIQERVEALKAQGKIDEANQLMASVGNEKEAQAALTRISAQDRFNAAMEKLQATVTSLVEGPAMNLVNMMASLASNAKALKLLFGGIAAIIAGIKLTSLITGLISALATSGALAATTAATASALTLGVGAVAIVGGIVAIMAALSSAKSDAKANDGFFPAAGGSGYGKRTLLGPEGAIQLNNKDSVIAGTDLFGSKSSKGDDVVSAPEGVIKMNSGGGGGDMSAIVNAISQLRADINALAGRPIDVSIDGTKVIEATTGANPNADGDAMRKNSYKVQ
jgi:hypothetical protein